MTSAPTIPATTSVSGASSRTLCVQDTRERLRLRLKPKAPTTGWVDGGWWPRSWDLAAELPGLLAVLAVRLGGIERGSYHPGGGGPTVRKISVDGGGGPLEGVRTPHPKTGGVLASPPRDTPPLVPPP